MMPIQHAPPALTNAHGQVMATRPASMPLHIIEGSGFFVRTHHIHMVAARAPVAEASAIAGHLRSAEVRVGCGIAMAGKMFCGDQHPGRMRPFDISVNECAYLLGIFAEGTRINDRIIRI